MVRPVSYPDLPVVERREDILAALANHQVVIVCGETGSGKTTQLPKICLEAGRGEERLIGHTQPRRLAARTVAARIASELGEELGQAVGFKIRFTDQVSAATRVKLMTDGILLAETRGDPLLKRYDTIIIDEAHERSLNIDFLLGYLKRILPKRPDLKLVITSATIDPERFAHHFDGAPIITAEGRTYPVEVRYAPVIDEDAPQGDDEEERDMPAAIVDACEELLREHRSDVLVFLPGEREIREAADRLQKQAGYRKALKGVEVLPLYSRLSNAEQNRIFRTTGTRRIVLATNVAETSLTVPGIRSVVDTGLARISRYSVRSKLQRLPIERISQASANQRKGRCGRVAPGTCIRLYSEDDFERRPEFTEPEILRTNLASVILQMRSMRLGDIDAFPFVEPPERRFVNDGYRTLQELNALDDARELTELGARLARLPIDPRLGRMLLAAADEGCVNEVLTIVSALSVQDPRERPHEAREKADALHAEFNDESSDFAAWLNLWAFLTVQRDALSHSKFRKMCKERYLNAIRTLEWMDVRRQLAQLAKELKLPVSSTEAPAERVHRALLTGLLANVAVKTDKRDYLGTRNRHLQIFPGSSLSRKGPKWIMAGEVTETSRTYARSVAAIVPEWIERAGEHLLQYSYRDPQWNSKFGTVNAYAQSTLYGLVINPKKRVDYTRINPAESRRILIREGLVGGELRTKGQFHRHNLALLTEVTTLEEKARRRDIVVDPEELVRFYDAIVPEHVNTAKLFEQWRAGYEHEHPRGLYFSRDLLLRDDAQAVNERDFPNQIEMGSAVLPLKYRFAPDEADDGVTLVSPVALLNRVSSARCEWLVPGLLEDRIAHLIKALPKPLRRNFVPAPDYARACNEAMTPDDKPLAGALSRQLQRMTGIEVPQSAWDASTLPRHLRMRFEVVDDDGKIIDEGRDLEALQKRYLDRVEESLVRFGDDSMERDAVTEWNFGDLAESVDIDNRGVTHARLSRAGGAQRRQRRRAPVRRPRCRARGHAARRACAVPAGAARRGEVPETKAPRARRHGAALHPVRQQAAAGRRHRGRRHRRDLPVERGAAAHARRVPRRARTRARRLRRHRERDRRARRRGARAAQEGRAARGGQHPLELGRGRRRHPGPGERAAVRGLRHGDGGGATDPVAELFPGHGQATRLHRCGAGQGPAAARRVPARVGGVQGAARIRGRAVRRRARGAALGVRGAARAALRAGARHAREGVGVQTREPRARAAGEGPALGGLSAAGGMAALQAGDRRLRSRLREGVRQGNGVADEQGTGGARPARGDGSRARVGRRRGPGPRQRGREHLRAVQSVPALRGRGRGARAGRVHQRGG